MVQWSVPIYESKQIHRSEREQYTDQTPFKALEKQDLRWVYAAQRRT